MKEVDSSIESGLNMHSDKGVRASSLQSLWREGDYWAVRFGGQEARMRDSKGLAYLAQLLQHPDREFHALDLYRLIELPAASRPGTPDPGSELRPDSGRGAGPALDSKAKAAYLARIEELREELADAEKWNDLEKAARARAELEALADQMAESVGLGGRDRPMASDAERARQNVSRAIHKAVRAIGAEIPPLGAHLERAIKTGTFISYRAASDAPVAYLSKPPSAEALVPPDQSGRPLPTGIVTFLMTDIEGSTRLWERYPNEMESALSRHDRLIQDLVERHMGILIKTKGEGDSTFSVFGRATHGASCAIDVMRALLREDFGLHLKVRMALHSGEAEVREEEYFGPAVNRCARVREIVHGGQIVISTSTYELVRDRLAKGASIRDLGMHQLRDLERPEPLYQLVHPDLPQDFPPLRSTLWRPHNLPAQLTSFVGRDAELSKIPQLLREARLVTLTGAGGSGKTRLAVEAASQNLSDWPDGVWLVDLAPILEPDYVSRAVALALGVKETPRRPVIEDIIERIGDGRTLLIFDNCEHLLDRSAEIVSSLLQSSEGLSVLATSREPLGVMGEITFRISSLALPDEGVTFEQIRYADSVRLFIDRARASFTNFQLGPETASAVAYICRRLDGLPLAIELAAARIKMFSVHDLAANLEDTFKLLSGGLRASLPRHRTLEATVSWSYDLLTDRQKAFFDRLSVFSGGWTLDSGLEVLGNLGWDRQAVMEDLESLIDKSLVVRDELPGGRVRYRMLETLRQYGSANLAESGRIAEARDAHLDWMRRVAQEADAKLDGPQAPSYLDLLEEELDNLRSALEWSIASAKPDEGFEIAAAGFGNFWLWRSHLPEARSWMKRLLDLSADASPLHAKALHCAGRLAFQSGDWDEGVAFAERARDMYRAVGDPAGEARSILYVAMNKWSSDAAEEIEQLIEEALEPARRAGQPVELALALGLMALWLAPIDTDRARQFGDEAAKFADISRSLNWIAHVREFRAHVAIFSGDLDAAAELLTGAIPLYNEVGNRSCGAHCLETVAAYMAERGDLERAGELLGAMEAERETLGSAPPAYERIGYERGMRAVRGGLDESSLNKAWEQGRSLDYQEAMSRALGFLEVANQRGHT